MVRRSTALSLLGAALLALFAGGAPAAVDATTPPKLFPVVVKGTNGPVTIRKRPVRIVSLSPTATEMLFAVGAGAQVVAVDDQSNYPRVAPRTALSGFRPNAEAIARYRPDLVVIAYDTGILAELRRLGITVLHLDGARTLAEAYRQLSVVGRATGHPGAATRAVRSMRTRIDAAVRSARQLTASRRLSVYHELTPDYYSASSRTFIGHLYRMLGLRNIADAATDANGGYPKLSPEYVIAANPTVIVLADTKCCAQSARTVAARPGWSGIAAVRTGRVVRVDDDVASRWGPRIAGLIRAVANALR
jgi:iron complex transport system substrate-binding protein